MNLWSMMFADDIVIVRAGGGTSRENVCSRKERITGHLQQDRVSMS